MEIHVLEMNNPTLGVIGDDVCRGNIIYKNDFGEATNIEFRFIAVSDEYDINLDEQIAIYSISKEQLISIVGEYNNCPYKFNTYQEREDAFLIDLEAILNNKQSNNLDQVVLYLA